MVFRRVGRPYFGALSLCAACALFAQRGLSAPTAGFAPLPATAPSEEHPQPPSAPTSKRITAPRESLPKAPSLPTHASSSDAPGAKKIAPAHGSAPPAPRGASQPSNSPYAIARLPEPHALTMSTDSLVTDNSSNYAESAHATPQAPPASVQAPPMASPELPRLVPGGGADGALGSLGPALDMGSEGTRRPRGGWRLSVEGAARLPVDLGAQLRLQSPYWLRLTAGIGNVPGTFIDGATGALASQGSLDAVTSTVIASTFSKGVTWNMRVGIRPSERFGFYADAGFGSMTLEGELELQDVASVNLPSQLAGITADDLGEYQYRLVTDARVFLLEAGWEGHVGRHVLFGVGVGFLVATSSTTTTEANFEPPDVAEVRTVLADAESLAISEIDDNIESFGFVPTLSLRLGVDFF